MSRSKSSGDADYDHTLQIILNNSKFIRSALNILNVKDYDGLLDVCSDSWKDSFDNEVNHLRELIIFQRDHVRFRNNHHNNKFQCFNQQIPSGGDQVSIYLGVLFCDRVGFFGFRLNRLILSVDDEYGHDYNVVMNRPKLLIGDACGPFTVTEWGAIALLSFFDDSTVDAPNGVYVTYSSSSHQAFSGVNCSYLASAVCGGSFVTSVMSYRNVSTFLRSVTCLLSTALVDNDSGTTISALPLTFCEIITCRGDKAYCIDMSIGTYHILCRRGWFLSTGVIYSCRLVSLLTQQPLLVIHHRVAAWGDVTDTSTIAYVLDGYCALRITYSAVHDSPVDINSNFDYLDGGSMPDNTLFLRCHAVALIEHGCSTPTDIIATSTPHGIFEPLVISPSSNLQVYPFIGTNTGLPSFYRDLLWMRIQRSFINFNQSPTLVFREKNGETLFEGICYTLRYRQVLLAVKSACFHHDLSSLWAQHRIANVLLLVDLATPDVVWGELVWNQDHVYRGSNFFAAWGVNDNDLSALVFSKHCKPHFCTLVLQIERQYRYPSGEVCTTSTHGQSVAYSFWITIVFFVGTVPDIMVYATAGLVSIDATLTSGAHNIALFALDIDVSLIDINTHHGSWNDGELIHCILLRNFESHHYEFEYDSSLMPSTVRSTASFIRRHIFTCRAATLRMIHMTGNDTRVHPHNPSPSRRHELCSLRKYVFGSASGSTSGVFKTFYITPSSGVAQSSTFCMHPHQIQFELIKCITCLPDGRYIDLSVNGSFADGMSSRAAKWGECCCGDVMTGLDAHVQDISDGLSFLFNSVDGDIPAYYANVRSWLIQVDQFSVGIDVYSPYYCNKCHSIRSGITYPSCLTTIDRVCNCNGFNMPDFSSFIIRHMSLEMLRYNEVHNASITTASEVIDANDIYSKSCCYVKFSGFDTEMPHQVMTRYARRSSLHAELYHLRVQCSVLADRSSDDVPSSFERRWFYEIPTNNMGTSSFQREISVDRTYNVRTTSCRQLISSHANACCCASRPCSRSRTSRKRSRQLSHLKICCSRGRGFHQSCSCLNTNLNTFYIVVMYHFAWSLYVIASNECMFVEDYGESTSVGICWVQYGFNLFLQVMKFILLCGVKLPTYSYRRLGSVTIMRFSRGYASDTTCQNWEYSNVEPTWKLYMRIYYGTSMENDHLWFFHRHLGIISF